MTIAFIIAIIYGVSGIGLLLYKNWARIVSIMVAPLSVICLSWIMIINKKDIDTMITPTIGIIVFLFSIFYLTRPKVKEQFKEK